MNKGYNKDQSGNNGRKNIRADCCGLRISCHPSNPKKFIVHLLSVNIHSLKKVDDLNFSLIHKNINN